MRRGMLVGVVGGLVAAALAAPAASAAPTLVTRASDVRHGPELAGERLFYGDLRGSLVRLVVAGPNEPRRTLGTATIPGDYSEEQETPGDYRYVRSQIGASAERLAFVETHVSGNARYQQGVSNMKVLGGPPTGALAQLESCGHTDPVSPVASTVDVDGPRIAATDCSGRIVIREGDAIVGTITPGQNLAAGTIALAGRYVAYNAYGVGPTATTPTTTTVHDWMTGTKVYEIPRQLTFDLQADGKLASVTATPNATDCADHTAQWFSPADPTEHVLPVRPCTDAVRIANDRVALITNPEDAPQSQRLLTLAGTDGSVAYVARLGVQDMPAGGHDYDGQRVAYGVRNCAGGTDLLTESATDPQPRDEDPRCVASVRSSSAALGPQDAYARFALRCEDGCRGTAFIRMRVGREVRTVGTRSVRIQPDGPCDELSIRVKLTARARRELRERGSVRTDLRVITFDRAGGGRTLKRKLTLRAASRNAGKPRDCAV